MKQARYKKLITNTMLRILILLSLIISLCQITISAQSSYLGNSFKIPYPTQIDMFPNGPKHPQVKPDSLEVAEFDFPEKLNWYDAVREMNKAGNGWRLPHPEELKILNLFKESIPNMKTGTYWGGEKALSSKDQEAETANSVIIFISNKKRYSHDSINSTASSLILNLDDIPGEDDPVVNIDDIYLGKSTLSTANVRFVRGQRNKLNSFTSAQIIGTPIVVGNLEIAEFDIPQFLNLDEARNACSSLGKGWRLPTIDELGVIQKNIIFKRPSPTQLSSENSRAYDLDYLSNSPAGTSNYDKLHFYVLNMNERNQIRLRTAVAYKNEKYRVRAVKTK